MSSLSIKNTLINQSTNSYGIRSPSSNINLQSEQLIKHFNVRINNSKSSYKEIDIFQVKHLVDELNNKFNLLDTKIELQLDKATKEIVVKIVDKNTGKIIRQIPPEELLKISSAFKEILRGNLLNKKI